jgi:hypothetical protein
MLLIMRHHHQVTNRAAYSPAELAAACGKHPTWAYRQIYAGKLKVITEVGRMLIPASELERVLGQAKAYDPKPKARKAKAGEESRKEKHTPEGQLAEAN